MLLIPISLSHVVGKQVVINGLSLFSAAQEMDVFHIKGKYEFPKPLDFVSARKVYQQKWHNNLGRILSSG